MQPGAAHSTAHPFRRQADTAFTVGMACALLSGALFLLLATFFAMPVSTTHAIVGAVLGMTVVGAGTTCVHWGYPGLLTIVASWFASPLLAGVLSAAMHLAIQRGVFKVPPELAHFCI